MEYLYLFNPTTHEYTGKTIKERNPKATDTEDSYFKVPYSTEIAPPEIIPGHSSAIFDPYNNVWRVVYDYRGTTVINTITKEISIYDKLGPISYPYTTDLPDPEMMMFLKYDSGEWKLDRDEILNAIWEIRKSKRDAECASDLEYNGHLYHVDAISFNDILLSAQDALISNDFTTEKRWITADDINVVLTGADLIAIVRLYGARRQRLVYESNDAWQADILLSDEELINLYSSLTSQ